MTDNSKDQFSDEEVSRRRDDVLRRMLKTPPAPHRNGRKAKTVAKSRTARKSKP